MTVTIFAQDTFPPVSISQGTFLGESIPLRDLERAVPLDESQELRIVQINKWIDPKMNITDSSNEPDPLFENNDPFRAPQDILENFDGLNQQQCNCTPPDPTGAAGPNHYVHAVNLSVVVYDKSGNIVMPAVLLGSFFGNGISDGDPIIMYDQLADRWFISQFNVNSESVYMAVSTSSDPTGTYNMYDYSFSPWFPDYPHYSVWPDAYYLTTNHIAGTAKGGTFAIERDVMIAGGPNPQIISFDLPGRINNPLSVESPKAANLLGTTFPANLPGYIVDIEDNTWPGSGPDDIAKIWEITLDWVTPANSTVSAPSDIVLDEFDTSVAGVKQPVTTVRLDVIPGKVDYAVNYRSFAGHNSFLFSFSVDLNVPTTSSHGIRWVELRNTGTGPFSLYQEGSWGLGDGESRWFASTAMDEDGNIALAYNKGSETDEVGIYFTGRLDGDPLGQMSFEEQEIHPGVSFQSTSNRFGDYNHMTIDPDGETFWFTAQYFEIINRWRTRIASFNLDGLPILGDDDLVGNIISYDVYPINSSLYEIELTTQSVMEDVKFQVTDIQGRILTTGELEMTSTGNKGTFSRANLSTGVYMVRVYNNNFQQTKKIAIK